MAAWTVTPDTDAHHIALERARQSLAARALRQGDMRLRYHFTPPYGWMNDPNGLIWWRGEYHLFYQHNPYDTRWAGMHWGHAVSDDLLHWRDLPVALAPSEPYDAEINGGCYSGSAIAEGDALALLYTGCARMGERERQTQNLAVSRDGVNFVKATYNPVIAEPPPGASEHFRDPKVWRQGDGWYMVVGNSVEGSGCVQLYYSGDLREWAYRGVLYSAEPGQGWMWECPDFFPLGERWMLTVSAMESEQGDTLWFVGDFDVPGGRFTATASGKLDEGRDYYAAQSLLDAQGRRVLIGWAGARSLREGLPMDVVTRLSGYCGHMAAPRTLTLGGDGLPRFTPHETLQTLRGEHRHGEAVWTHRRALLLGQCRPAALEARLTIDLGKGDSNEIVLTVRHGETRKTTLTVNRATGTLTLNRDETDAVSQGQDVCTVGRPDTLSLHLLIDRTSLEVFIQEGRFALSANLYPETDAASLWLSTTDGGCLYAAWDVWSLRA